MRKTTLIFAIISLSICNLSAQISIDEYRQAVAEYSHQIAAQQAVVDGSVADLARKRKGYLPELDIERAAEYRSNTEKKWSWMMQPTLSQTIYNGGGTKAAIKQAENRLDISQAELEYVELQTLYNAEVSYWHLSRAEIYRDAIADYLAIITSLQEVVARRFKEGYTSKSDLLQVESRLSDAEYQLSAANQSYLIALHNFNKLCGKNPTESVTLVNSILDSLSMPERHNIAEIISYHPEYRAAIARSEVARWGVKAAGAAFMPKISLRIYGVIEPEKPYVVNGDIGIWGGAGISLSSPIFHFRERRDAMNVARSEQRIAELATEDLIDRLSLDESNGWTNLQNSYSRVKATQRSLAIAEENLEISTYAYNEGSASILDVLQAQMSWLQIYTNTITAQYDYAVAIAAYLMITNQIMR
jgi:outer membrane protein TolC